MLNHINEDNRKQLSICCIEDLVPKDHILRKIDKAIDFNFIYDLVKDKYSEDTGRPSIDPVVLFKIVFIQYLFGIRSMRQTIKEIEVNAAYRWFLGYDWNDPIPHFTHSERTTKGDLKAPTYSSRYLPTYCLKQ